MGIANISETVQLLDNMAHITRQLAEYVAELSFEKLPEEVRHRTKFLLLDLVGIAIRARHEANSTESVRSALVQLGLSQGRTSVIGDNESYAPPGAALFNGTLAHSLDFDDTHAAGSIHSSAPIVPAALAAAELNGCDGKTLIAGIVAGYEAQIRLSLALVPKDHYARGFHPTATCGTFGAAAAAARVLSLSADQVVNTFGVCGSQAAGSMQFLANGAWNKRLHVGAAAMNGLMAAQFAKQGFKGATDAIEGKDGFLNSYAPNPVPERVLENLGKVYETLAIAIKPYPACRYSHAAIDAIKTLRTKNPIDVKEIQDVEIGLPRTGWNIIGSPQTEKQHPENVVDGQFSMPFVAAIALREGDMQWDHYARHLGNATTLALCKKINTIVDPLAEAEFPRQMSGVARVRTSHGQYEKFVKVPKGEPENFLSEAELINKFNGLVGHYIESKQREELLDMLLNLHDAKEVGVLLQLTRPGSSEY